MSVIEEVAALLKARGETIAVAESSAGGLISAALLSQGGASAYYRGGAIVYTPKARAALMGLSREDMGQMRSASEPYARFMATHARQRMNATWGLAETGAAGPSGNAYGDAAGHCCLAVSGPVDLSLVIETGHGDRAANMETFRDTALKLLLDALRAA
ncbi:MULTISPECIES: CinA family protein [Caulobacter]|jgi:nicotinamide-nucleotide amidase|uniref:Competence/damage-inducible protein cinA n=1 Tax=Caulobacter vibrioides OR37 TaxID=1292034 RepID=R0E3N8_CAUVI|nr:MULTISPECIES: CinA family protein [Caulobacter]ENZ80198.1 competence/damage-inducible protein cinA [Caulobacter vibrioides OR37]MBQ1562031.1 CinA family protein [Caulobacter sp.]